MTSIQEKSQGYSSSYEDVEKMIGKKGVAYTILRPSGKVIIDDEVYDATALSAYIEKGEQIEVVRYETSSLFVKKI